MRNAEKGEQVAEYVIAWQCIGCGKIEAPQTCVGICQDRKVEFVYAQEHRAAINKHRDAINKHSDAMAGAQAQVHEMKTLVRHLAWTTPRDGEWEHSYRALQARARQSLAHASAVNTN